jgi:hypothetical protein
MTRDEILNKAAQAMFETHDPGHARERPPGRWAEIALHMYRSRFITGLNAVEDDIRRDERNRISAWLRECADRREWRFHSTALQCMALELDRRPIEEQ